MAINGNAECEKALCGNVNKIVLQEKEVKTNCEVCPDAGYSGLSRVVVNVPTGGDGGIDLEDVVVSAVASDSDGESLSVVLEADGNVETKTFDIPSDQDAIVPEIIKKGKNILGVEGTLEEGGVDINDAKVVVKYGTVSVDQNAPLFLKYCLTDGTETSKEKSVVYTYDPILPNVIKKGTNILGVEGTYEGNGGLDTNEATATAEDILRGKTAFAKGAKITGTIDSIGNYTITPSTQDQPIPSGSYIADPITVKGDSDLKSENIKKGVTIFEVTGTLDGDGIIPEGTEYIYGNGIYEIANKEYVDVQVPTGITPEGTINITQNDKRYDVSHYEYADVDIDIPTPSGTINLNENKKLYDVAEYASAYVDVDVPTPSGMKTLTENHKEYDVAEYASAYVDVPTPTGTRYIDKNDTYDVVDYAKAIVEVKPTLEVRTVAPQTQAIRVEPSAGYDGLGAVNITAIQTEEKTITSKANAEYTPSTGKFFSKVTVDIDDEIELQERTVSVTENKTVEIEPEEGYDGLTKAIVEVNVDADIELIKASEDGESLDVSLNIGGKDAEKVYEFPSEYHKIEASVIKKDVNILGVVGELEDAPLDDVEVSEVTVIQSEEGDEEVEGRKLAVALKANEDSEPITKEYEIPSNYGAIVPSVIKKDVNILGVTGTLEDVPIEDVEVSSVTVLGGNGGGGEKLTLTLCAGEGEDKVIHNTEYDISAAPIVPSVIKKGTNILGVVGELEGASLDDVTVVPSSVHPVRSLPTYLNYQLTDGVNTSDEKTITMETPIVPEVIKKGEIILGVEGTYEGDGVSLDDIKVGGVSAYNASGEGGRRLLVVIQEGENGTPVTKEYDISVYHDSIVPSVIKKGTNILGVVGEYEGEPFDLCIEGGQAEVNLPNAKQVKASAFYNDYELTSVSMPNVTVIGKNAFNGCSNLTTVIMPKVITLVEQAFTGCTNLVLTSLPNTITSIGDHAFKDCKQLKATSLPSGLTSIGTSAFYGCEILAITKIPEGVTNIGTSAFANCKKIKTMTLPSSLSSMGNLMFYNCILLNTVTFKGTPTSIGSDLFNSCGSLTKIYVPWAEGAVAGAPWGANKATIYYNSEV